jgi:SAM-dependent methyltransferase
MHLTAEKNVTRFFETYVYGKNENCKILEIGSYIGGFSIRSLKPEKATYIGVDLTDGPGVDIVLEDQYKLPFEDNSFDYVISSSCFEHSEFFWLTFLEIIRVLKPTGVFYLNAPSNGAYHRYPVDCWRFFPDSGLALSRWANKNGFKTEQLECYTSDKELDIWSDYVVIFIKDIDNIDIYKDRIIKTFERFTNGMQYPNINIINELKW